MAQPSERPRACAMDFGESSVVLSDGAEYAGNGLFWLLVFRKWRYTAHHLENCGTLRRSSRLNRLDVMVCQTPRMKLRLATVLLSLLPLAATAQTLRVPGTAPSATPLVDRLLATDAQGESADGATPVLPIWSGRDGELLAVVALPRGWVESPLASTPAYAGPSTWRLAGMTSSASGASLQWANGLRLDALLGQFTPSAQGCPGLACDTGGYRGATSAVLDMGWTSPQGTLDFSYGLSWLKSAVPSSAADALFDPLSGLGGRWYGALANHEESALFARGRWHFDQGGALDLSASYGRMQGARMAGALLPAIDIDQLSLSLGIDVGSLRGAIVGHVLSSDDPLLAGKRWTTLDLGLSWRTPWAGELSVGAQNILSAQPASPRDADSQARTPYIQYRQDL